MSNAARLATLAMVFLPPARAVADGPEGPGEGAIRAAVGRVLPLLERGSAGYVRQRDCFSCHHQAVPALALSLARGRGFAVDEENFRAQVEQAEADMAGAAESYRKGSGQGGGVTRAGYALWTLALGGHPADETTDAVVSYLLRRDDERGHWRTSSNRPPSEVSPFTSTFVAIRGLQAYAPEDQHDRVAARVERARAWLVETPGRDTEDRAFRLWALKLAGADAETVAEAADALAATRRDDGGWAQLDDRESDAYATGTALVALHEAAGLPADDPIYRRGLAFLIADQLEDGSWHVVSRSKPFQTYFESGFPHGPDQWISMAASGWAAAALLLALPPGS